MTEQEQFLKDLDQDQNPKTDILDQPFDDPTEATDDSFTGKTDDSDDEGDILTPKNRRERRLVNKLQQERESSIFLAGKLEARKEAEKAVTEESDYLKSVERIYGTETPEAQLATDLLKKAFSGVREDAKREALAEIRQEREREAAEQQQAESELDGFVEEIEDTYGVTLSATQEKGFFQMLQKMSPKDNDGNVVNFADPHAVWEIYQDRIQKRTDNRAKDLSNRSMVQSGATKDSTLPDDATERYLKENGLI